MKLKSHSKRCLKSDEMFTCKICRYRSGTSTGLAIHFKNNHPHEKYQKICLGNKKCTRCDYSTTTADKLNKHKKKCLKSSELFTCESCDYKSGTSLGLSIHFKNSHPNQKLYKKCSRCDYARIGIVLRSKSILEKEYFRNFQYGPSTLWGHSLKFCSKILKWKTSPLNSNELTVSS